jgi:hypothetical protein
MNTDELIAHSRARFDHANARRLLKEKYQAKMLFAYRGGMWRAGPELNNMIFTCGRIGEVVLPDQYENPVMIDTKELMALSQERWHEQINAWHQEYEDLNKNR